MKFKIDAFFLGPAKPQMRREKKKKIQLETKVSVLFIYTLGEKGIMKNERYLN